ncbi:MAG: ribosomal protein S19 family protein [archaeon]
MAEQVIRTSKEVFYRGKTIEHWKQLEVREFAKYLTARSRRSVLRHFDVVENFVKACEEKVSRNKKIRTHQRDIVIVPKLVGMTIGIYNGKEFMDILMSTKMIGHRLGEFAPTRQKVNHGEAGIGATKGSKADKK